MRPAPAERTIAEEFLEMEGWILIEITKHRPQAHIASVGAQPILTWCERTLGPGRVEPRSNWFDDNDVWYMFSWYGHLNFWFKHSKDATAFTLRWM